MEITFCHLPVEREMGERESGGTFRRRGLEVVG